MSAAEFPRRIVNRNFERKNVNKNLNKNVNRKALTSQAAPFFFVLIIL